MTENQELNVRKRKASTSCAVYTCNVALLHISGFDYLTWLVLDVLHIFLSVLHIWKYFLFLFRYAWTYPFHINSFQNYKLFTLWS